MVLPTTRWPNRKNTKQNDVHFQSVIYSWLLAAPILYCAQEIQVINAFLMTYCGSVIMPACTVHLPDFVRIQQGDIVIVRAQPLALRSFCCKRSIYANAVT